MNTRENINQELAGLQSSLPSYPALPVYAVPEGYFEALPGLLLLKVKGVQDARRELEELSPLLARLPKRMPFEVPEGYFQKNGQVEEDPIPSFGKGIRVPYTVPAGYFDTLLPSPLKKTAKVVSMNRPRFVRMAVAAAMTAIMAISGLFYYYERNNASDVVAIKGVTDQDIEQFINEVDGTPSTREIAQSENEVRNMVKDVSDKELDAFLSQLPPEELDVN